MTIQYLHASKFGNGVLVASRFREYAARRTSRQRAEAEPARAPQKVA